MTPTTKAMLQVIADAGSSVAFASKGSVTVATATDEHGHSHVVRGADQNAVVVELAERLRFDMWEEMSPRCDGGQEKAEATDWLCVGRP